MARHARDRVRDLASRASDPRVLKQDHLAAARQGIGDRGIPVVQGSGEMLQADERDAGAAAEAPIGIRLERRLDELRRGGDIAGGATATDAMAVSPSLAECERIGLNAGIEELDLEVSIDDATGLANQLIHALFNRHAVAALVDVEAMRGRGRLAVERHAKADRAAGS